MADKEKLTPETKDLMDRLELQTNLRERVMMTMIHNCLTTIMISSALGEAVPNELEIVQISMVSVFAAAFDEDPDEVYEELKERVAQATATP
jgi:hypothetical protein